MKFEKDTNIYVDNKNIKIIYIICKGVIIMEEIEKRNTKVEADKYWETSLIRKLIIIILTYIFAVLYLKIEDNTNLFLGVVVSGFGFYISTQLIEVIKKLVKKEK